MWGYEKKKKNNNFLSSNFLGFCVDFSNWLVYSYSTLSLAPQTNPRPPTDVDVCDVHSPVEAETWNAPLYSRGHFLLVFFWPFGSVARDFHAAYLRFKLKIQEKLFPLNQNPLQRKLAPAFNLLETSSSLSRAQLFQTSSSWAPHWY